MTDEVSATQVDREAASQWSRCWMGKGVPGDPATLAEAFARHRVAHTEPLAKPLLSLVNTMREYLPPDGISKDEFINRVLGVLDNDEMAELVSKLEAGK